MQRAVISLPPAELEDDLRVQVIVGKTMPTDCNVHFFPARLQHDTLPGSGYPSVRRRRARADRASSRCARRCGERVRCRTGARCRVS
ncbi:ecotin family protein [Burkholderia glumae]|uniref:ecotin family protein n=1 Tax=Burkholderia glumae TaxID=337 RepID=UPI00265E7657|nr:ecotin family protein [Burkholderia glumae]